MVCQVILLPPSAFTDFSNTGALVGDKKVLESQKQFWIARIQFTSEYQQHKPYYTSYQIRLQRHMQAEQPLLMRQIRAKGLMQSMVLNRELHFFFFC